MRSGVGHQDAGVAPFAIRANCCSCARASASDRTVAAACGVQAAATPSAAAWTDLLTDLAHSEITDVAYAAIHEHFTPEEVAALTATIAHIGVFNRLGNAYKFTPPFASRRET
jgi:alkylhydroperoxidase family enzyme